MTAINQLNSQNRCQILNDCESTITSVPKPAIFLDRDGVIIEDNHYLKDPAKVVLCKGVTQFFQISGEKNIPIIIVTNQSGIFRGLLTWHDYQAVTEQMMGLLGNPPNLLAIYANSCSPDASKTSWRKPSPEMIKDAAKRFNIDLGNSVMIGDRMSDIEAGVNAGIGNLVHVLTGHGHAHKSNFLALASRGKQHSNRNFWQIGNLSGFSFKTINKQKDQ